MRSPLRGAPCDSQHPFPAPKPGGADWIDSMEYGARVRRPGSRSMWDVDTTPTWRMIAAYVWNADCYQEHVHEVAADPFLTTHLIAVATLVGLPKGAVIEVLALGQVGGGGPINALREHGLAAGRAEVELMSPEEREALLLECVPIVLVGWRTLRSDINDQVVKGRSMVHDA